MNIFVLHHDAMLAAHAHCDKHVPKMILEAAQMLSTAHRILDGELYTAPSKSGKRMVNHYRLPVYDDIVYKAAYASHPCTQWVIESSANYRFLFKLYKYLLGEFRFRFMKTHKSAELYEPLFTPPKNINDCIKQTPFALAMPDQYKVDCPVQSYRNYYLGEKADFAKWEKSREAPEWWDN
tara:strand:- start:5108 stop:5647 length:540 start_codon:yes stop_codon:yes gene_type:complete